MVEQLYGYGGEFTEDDLCAFLASEDQAAAQFLKALDKVSPQVLDQLKEDVYPRCPPNTVSLIGQQRSLVWRFVIHIEDSIREKFPDHEILCRDVALENKYRRQRGEYRQFDSKDTEPKYEGMRLELEPALEALQEWFLRFGLWSRPVAQVVIESLADWKYHETKDIKTDFGRWGVRVAYFQDPDRNSKEWPELPLLLIGSLASLSPEQSRFELIIEKAWEPFKERWGTAERRIEQAFKNYLQEYRQHISGRARQMGHEAPRKYEPDHFLWLAHYQVLRESFSKIRNTYGKSRRAVSGGVHSAAALIELSVRSAKRTGRPPGRRESGPRRRLGERKRSRSPT